LAVYNKFNNTTLQMVTSSLNVADTWKVALLSSGTAPVATNVLWSALTGFEISGINGYTTGGASITLTSSNISGVESVYFTVASPTWTGSTATSSAGFGPFRYIVIWDTTSSNTLAWFDYGSGVTVFGGDTFTLASTGTGVLFTVT
jgi:hypothetical protein